MCRTDQLVVSSPTGEMRTINLLHKTKKPLPSVTVRQLKTVAVKEFPKLSGKNVDVIKLVCEAKPLDKDSAPLSEYGVKAGAVVQMVRKVNGG
ncbi:uncharacterized protein zgc:194655 isoform X1 [Acanthochromis polyacanthus]|uniref:uncharacterized protein zgc:194655 isoform X1 n=1 Tax=Acanthochromis polyacanthus TaxID=80966 RepID=UPI0022349FB1|nr:uncharacterized protein zgc:194655 isoform X1 [Acanthochromis polyacanthus]